MSVTMNRSGRHGQRVTVACSHCRLAKAKCDRRRPCLRCEETCRSSTCSDSAQLKRGPKRRKLRRDGSVVVVATPANLVQTTTMTVAVPAFIHPQHMRNEMMLPDDNATATTSPSTQSADEIILRPFSPAISSLANINVSGDGLLSVTTFSPLISPSLQTPPPLSVTAELEHENFILEPANTAVIEETRLCQLINDNEITNDTQQRNQTVIPATPSHVPYPKLFCIVIGTVTSIVDRWSIQIRSYLFTHQKVHNSLTNALTFYTKYLSDAFIRLERHEQLETLKAKNSICNNNNNNSLLLLPADPYYNDIGWLSESDLLSKHSPLPDDLRILYENNIHIPSIIIQCSNPHVPFINIHFANLLLYYNNNINKIIQNNINFYKLRHPDDIACFISSYMQAVATNTKRYQRIARYISAQSSIITVQETTHISYNNNNQSPTFLLVQLALCQPQNNNSNNSYLQSSIDENFIRI